MRPRLRRLVLTAHIVASVGWLGAVSGFFALGMIAMQSDHPTTVRGAYLVMEPAAWITLVPLALASLLTGLVQSLGTHWGLVRHYWVLFKLLINVFATTILLIYTATFQELARRAADPGVTLDEVRTPSPVVHATLGLALLLVATVLAVYKPRGLTPYGQRRRRDRAQAV